MSIYTFLFDSQGQDHEVKLDSAVLEAVGNQQLLWIDLRGEDEGEIQQVTDLLRFPEGLRRNLTDKGDQVRLPRPRLDLYSSCFHVTIQAVQERETASPSGKTAFRAVRVHFVVFANIVVTLHAESVAFLESFDRRIKGDTHLGTMDGPAFLGALLNWHVTGFFRALEILEADVDQIDDAALRLRRTREERDLLGEMVKARRRLAVVRRALLPHREVYATLARPNFAPFVTTQATETLRLVYEQLERAVEATENARELVLGSFDIFSTQTALRTNEVVKVLTMLSALLLPAGVIASLSLLCLRTPVYDLGRAGFWTVVIGMATVGIAFIVVARKRDWI